MINTMADEDAFVMPDAWQRARHPRRDRPDVPPAPAAHADAAEHARSLVDDVREHFDVIFSLPGTAPDIADAARAHLRGEPDPLGAAAIAYLTAPLHEMTRSSDPRPDLLFLDAMIAEHGVAFAARAWVEWAGIDVGDRQRPSPRGLRELRSMIVRHQPHHKKLSDWWLTRESARTLRGHLAAAPDDVYAEAVDLIAGARRDPLQKTVAAYLAPTREDWVEDLWAHLGEVAFRYLPSWLLFCALGRPHQLAALRRPLGYDCTDDVLATLIDSVGIDTVVPLLTEALDPPYYGETASIRSILGFLTALPRDEAFQALVDRIDNPEVVSVILGAVRRFPVRAMRLLPGSHKPRAAGLLSAHIRANPAIAQEVARELPAEQGAKIQEILAANTRVPEATDLPPLLTEPPWTRPRTRSKPVVVKDLPAPGSSAVAWGPGERDAWAARNARSWDRAAEGRDFADIAAKFQAGEGYIWFELPLLFLRGPEDLARPLVRDWAPRDRGYVKRDVHSWLGPLVARHEMDAHGPALAIARSAPDSLGHYLLPLLSDEIARSMADWLVRLKTAGRTARAWFRRHGTATAPSLIPDALGKAGPSRRAAEAALRFIADQHGPEPIVEAARVHGGRAAAAIETLLSTDPLDDLPKNVPVADWADPRVLPQILLRDRKRALPDEAARHVLTMLAMSSPDNAYPGVKMVRDLCDPASLAEFGWALFRWWELHGAPPKENWAFTQLALIGDDETVRRLTPVIRAWPGDGGHAKAVTGLDVLAAIGTDTALMHLHSIAQRVRFKGLRTRAQEKIEGVAAELELSAEQLADRLVPDFGLDASGTLTLDYGPRRFVIGFDERLRPTITDEAGKARTSLPKPGAEDDPELAPAAHKRFADLKKDLRTVAADLLDRFENAMVTGRRWPVAEFREFLVGHPLTGRLVRRLVWRAEDGPAFRVAEDGACTDAAGGAVSLPDTALVGIAHPVHLGNKTEAWSEVFADLGTVQPFEQLARPVHTLTDEERETGRLTRFEGVEVPIRDLFGLVRRGWERGWPMDAGIEWWISRRVAPDRHLVVTYEIGIPVGLPEQADDQTFHDVRVAVHPDRYPERSPAAQAPGALDPALVCEALADLTRLAEVPATGKTED